jgi:hypothetical protein
LERGPREGRSNNIPGEKVESLTESCFSPHSRNFLSPNTLAVRDLGLNSVFVSPIKERSVDRSFQIIRGSLVGR